MSSDTAEIAIVDPAGELAPAPSSDAQSAGGVAPAGSNDVQSAAPPRLSGRPGAALARRWAARVGPAGAAAARDCWRALWISRIVVLVAGVGAVGAFGVGRARSAYDPPGIVNGFGWLGDLLAAPVARWDAVWYLVIAHYGYRPDLTAARTAFFPLYPLGIRGISQLGVPPIAAGVALSMTALAAALYGIHRLSTLELGGLAQRAGSGDVARLAVLVTALSPMAFYFSAVYSESLYLALSVGVFWCARHGRWAWAGALGMLASATRSAGLVLALPMLMLYLYGPREDREPDFPDGAWWRPRYRMRRDLLWVAALPVGVAAYMAYLALAGGSALMPFHAQEVWNRHFVGPYVGVWDGARAAFDGVRQLLSFQRRHVYFSVAGGSPFVDAGHNVMLFAFLLAAVPMIVGVLRRLPLAYGAYVLAALALPLSYPVVPEPLMSLPRFEVVLFPLAIWLGAWLADRPRARLPALASSALLMAFFVGEFATWHWVA
jgi:Mannosyltransferase (PIG-V)